MSEVDPLTRGEWNERQSRIIHPTLADKDIIIAGAGMVGSWATLGLARVAGSITVLDFDEVEPVNIGVQAFNRTHEGMNKAKALASMCEGFPITVIEGTAPQDFPEVKFSGKNTMVVSAVDSLDARREIGEWASKNGVSFLVETRVRGELLAVLTVQRSEDYQPYISAIPQEDDVEDVPCGLNGAVQTGMFAGSKVVSAVNGFCKGLALPALRLYHVSSDIIITDQSSWAKE